MSQAKQALINKITRQFISQIKPGILRKLHLTEGYFNTGLPLNYKQHIIGNQPGYLGRIFDTVKLDKRTTAQFYKLISHSDDPIHEILVPLVDAIAKRVFDTNRFDLKEKIRADFEHYAEVRKQFSDTDFQNIILRAILGACSAMLVDYQSHKIKSLQTTDPEAAQDQNKLFSAKISGPIDAYAMTLTDAKLQADVASIPSYAPTHLTRQEFHWFIAEMLPIVNSFASPKRCRDADTHRPQGIIHPPAETVIEGRVSAMLEVLDKILDTIESSCAFDEDSQNLLHQLTTFRANLFGLIIEIEERREEGYDVETSAQLAFSGLCRGFYYRVNALVQRESTSHSQNESMLFTSIKALTDQLDPDAPDAPDSKKFKL